MVSLCAAYIQNKLSYCSLDSSVELLWTYHTIHSSVSEPGRRTFNAGSFVRGQVRYKFYIIKHVYTLGDGGVI